MKAVRAAIVGARILRTRVRYDPRDNPGPACPLEHGLDRWHWWMSGAHVGNRSTSEALSRTAASRACGRVLEHQKQILDHGVFKSLRSQQVWNFTYAQFSNFRLACGDMKRGCR